ncbi:MAG: hypothetical protein V3S69_04870 [Dehalococcoidales bacterium]
MDVEVTDDGIYMVNNCSQILTAKDAREMIEKEFGITVGPGWQIMQLTEEGEDQLTNYQFMSPEVWKKMVRKK